MDTESNEPSRPLPIEVEAIMAEEPAKVLARIVDEIHAHKDDEDFISMMGVGPLESLLHQGHGEALWPELERLARSDSLLRRALRGTWAYDSPEFDRREALLNELPDD